ncbi:MAG: DUF721 domain-containing protein [Veillonellales bacterium]
MYSLRDILPLTIKKLGLQKKYNAESAIQHWQEIVGEKISTHAAPVMVQRGVLLIAVSSPVWGHHLSMMKAEILSKINHFIGEKLIEDIRFQAGYLKNSQNQEPNEPEPSIQQQLRSLRLEETEVSAAYSLVEKMQDEQLRKKIFQIVKKDLKLKKAKQQRQWHPCIHCAALCPPEEQYCAVCQRERKEQVIIKVSHLLTEVPWLTYQELGQYMKCSPQEYSLGKEMLLTALLRDIHKEREDKLQILTLVMLTTGLKPEAVTAEMVTTTLEKFRRKKHVFTPGS